jgi:ParB family transcriptional regulator, chromosome partitioning protein
METIKQISIELIDPHPENPRKNLGNLTELAESIKANGIMQNLTVVPKDDGRYMAVIGHRRLAAAKLAGLETVPCAVVDMDRKTQLSTMLLENMQRSELSYIEQADGFQLMLDLGETVESISEMSGFSKDTVKHRLEIAKLDKDNILDSDLTLEDFTYLEKISDVNIRNKLIKENRHLKSEFFN